MRAAATPVSFMRVSSSIKLSSVFTPIMAAVTIPRITRLLLRASSMSFTRLMASDL